MSVRNGIVLLVALSTLSLLVGCGSSGNNNVTVTAPPTGGFSASSLNGVYVFTVSGTDVNGSPFAIAGNIQANGSKGITAGAIDINDPDSSDPILAPNSTITSGSYTIGVDGRGTINLGTSTDFGTIVLDFVLQDSSHGLITEFDGDASGTGTLDLQTSGTTPAGSYAFSFSGGLSDSFATVGNFTLSGTNITSGLEDFNNGGVPYTDQSLSGSVVVGPSSSPSTQLNTSSFSILYDVISIDASHLKFIEMDTQGTLVGDAFSQTSTAMPAGTLAFTLGGFLSGGTPLSLGGFMLTDSSGDINSGSTEDYNIDGTVGTIGFSGNYSSGGAGRYTLSPTNGFSGGSLYAAYPYAQGTSQGLLLLEIDDSLSIEAGAAYLQTAGATFATGEGYGLSLQGVVGVGTDDLAEVDDIAEFTASASTSSCGGVTTANAIGAIDENLDPGGTGGYTSQLCAAYTAPDANGRGQLGTVAENGTANGGFLLTFYTVDGTTFPFIESDGTQVSTGVFVEQNAAGSSAVAKPHMFVQHPLIRVHAAKQNKKLK